MEYAMIDKPAHCPQFQTDDGESESIESREFSLIKNEKTYILSLIKKDDALVFKILNYESKISLKVLSKKTKILIGKIDDAYNLFIKFFENEKVSIKNIQFAKAIKLEVSIVAPTGKEENIEFDLLYNIKNKNSFINDLQFKCSSLQEEIQRLKNEAKEMRKQLRDLLSFKNQYNSMNLLPDNNIANSNINDNNNIIIEEKKKNIDLTDFDIDKSIPKDLKFAKSLATNSYSDWGLDNVFTAFISKDKIQFLVYATKDKWLVFYNLNEMKEANTIKSAHSYYITNLHHVYDEQEKRDIIMSVAAEDNQIKLWDLSTFKLINKIKYINKNGYLLSACFLEYNGMNCIATSNGELRQIEFGPIKIYNSEGKKILDIKDSNYNTNYITTYYDNDTTNYYLISGNDGFIKSYDIKQKTGAITFVDHAIYENDPNPYNRGNSYRSAAIIDSEKIKLLIGSHDDGEIKIWNFYTVNLIRKIPIGNPLRGICIWNANYIFIGSKDKTIKIVDVKNGKIVNSIKAHKLNTVLSLKLIILDNYGVCLISQGMGKEEINLWEVQFEKIKKKLFD